MNGWMRRFNSSVFGVPATLRPGTAQIVAQMGDDAAAVPITMARTVPAWQAAMREVFAELFRVVTDEPRCGRAHAAGLWIDRDRAIHPL